VCKFFVRIRLVKSLYFFIDQMYTQKIVPTVSIRVLLIFVCSYAVWVKTCQSFLGRYMLYIFNKPNVNLWSTVLVKRGPVVSEKKIKNRQYPFDSFGPLVLLCINRVNRNKHTNPLLEDHPMSNPTKFGSNWCSGFKEDKQKRQHPVLNIWASCFFCVFLINKKTYTF
jgi:hypothetical protein